MNKITGVKYVGPIFDGSGYAKACRSNILALLSQGVSVTLSPISFENIKPDLSKEETTLKSLVNKDIDYNVVIVHTTPEFWEKYREDGKVNIAYTIWETTKLHPDWVPYINNGADKVLVGCEWNVDVFKDSGVTIPVGCIPHCIDIKDDDSIEPYAINGVSDDTFVFYDIFQWTERKDPLSLLKAYWYAFQNNEDVALVLKTYRSDYSDQEKNAIRMTIKRLKAVTVLDSYPKVYFIPDMLTEDEISGLHKRGDCYVTTDRGEGFGLSPFTAGAQGNPVVATGFGGSTEYLKADNSYLINYTLTPVHGMPWCISPDSLINTIYGYKSVESLSEGEDIFPGAGNTSRITKISDRQLNDDEYMLSFKSYSMANDIKITNSHKMFVESNGIITRKKAEDIEVGDYFVVPKLNFSDYANEVSASAPLFYLIGLYLAEGYVNLAGTNVGFAFHIDEKDTLAKTCEEIVKNLFNISDTSIYKRALVDRNGYEVYFNDRSLASFFKSNFGTGSNKKCIPASYKCHPDKDCREALLRGYWDGDGHISYRYKNKDKGIKRQSPECLAETVSKSLCLDLRDLLLSLDIVPSVSVTNREGKQVSYVLSVSSKKFDVIFDLQDTLRIKSRYRHKISEDLFAVLITKKEILSEYSESVYSLAVQPKGEFDKDVRNGSYLLNGVASSNSPWYKADQLWAQPDVANAAELLCEVYENQDTAKEKGLKLKQYINNNFSYEVIGSKIIKEIEEIL